MLKKIIIKTLITQFLFIVSASAQPTQFKPTDLNIEGLIGKVKRIEEESAVIKIKNGVTLEADRHPTRRLIFDKNGRLTYEWTQIEKLSPFEQNYFYDKKGNRHRRTSRINRFGSESSNIGIDQLSVSAYRFEPNVNALWRDEYIGDEIQNKFLRQKYQYIFDNAGRILEGITFDTKDEEVFRDVYIYGSEQLPNEKHLSMAGNPVGQIIKYKYMLDSQGNWIKRTAEISNPRKLGESKIEVAYRKISYYK